MAPDAISDFVYKHGIAISAHSPINLGSDSFPYNFIAMKNFRCVLLLLCISVVSPVFANDITLFGGLQHQGKVALSTRNPPCPQPPGIPCAVSPAGAFQHFNPKNFGVFGVRFAHGRTFGGEHTLAYNPNFVESQTKAVIYNSNLIVQVPLPKVRPYGTFGVGTFFIFGDGITDIGTKFALNYGGGLKIFPSGPIGGRIDVRGYRIPNITDPRQDQTLNIFEVSVGAVFSF